MKKLRTIVYVGIIAGAISISFYGYAYDSNNKKADLIIFSYDRPLQLYALLESVEKYITGLGDVQVIYRTSNDHYETAYNEVKKKFMQVFFRAQTSQDDFKPLTMKAFIESSHAYVLFAVDDIVVKDTINLDECITAMESAQAYGFFLRLGIHLTECYSENRRQAFPVLTHIGSYIYSWQFARGDADWRYPNTVDMTIYRKKDIEHYVRSLSYHNPNLLEGNWAATAGTVLHKIGLCYQMTKIVNIPLNRIQNIWNNRHMNSFSPLELLSLFNKGMKMDISPLYQIINKAAHIEYTPQFIQR